MYIILNTTFTSTLYTYQQVLHLIENDEAYKQKEPTGKKVGDREKERKIERKKDRKIKKERKIERVLRQDSDKGCN